MNEENTETYVIIGQCQDCDSNFVKEKVGDTHENCPKRETPAQP